jgi:hypothetical protein
LALPTSFRLPEDLLKRLDDEASSRGTSVTALVTAVLDEGLKIGRFSGIVYRDGPTGRRAGLAAGPDVWEVSVTSNKRLGPAKVVLSSLPSKRAYPCSRFGWRWTFTLRSPKESILALPPKRERRCGCGSSSTVDTGSWGREVAARRDAAIGGSQATQ